MKFHVIFLLAVTAILGNYTIASAQVSSLQQSQIDAVIGQVTNSATAESFVGGISGDGRLIVFESSGNIATDNPRNSDGNREVFIFDYAQRRIFQITDTKSLRNDTTAAYSTANTKVLITNVRSTISNDGRWIAFGSNATIAFPGNGTAQPPVVSATNPGSFDAEAQMNDSTGNNPLLRDGNTEMWLYQVPQTATATLSAGDEIPVTDLSGGAFIRVTNTLPSRLPFAATTTALPIIADDNRTPSINDSGSRIAFISNRNADTVNNGNSGNDANDEIFTYDRPLNLVSQITLTARGTAFSPLLNLNPTISGSGTRVTFESNADKPISGIAESNTDRNFEVFYADLDGSTGAVSQTGAKKQITVTASNSNGDVVNILDIGRRMSRDGRYIAFDSYADLVNNPSANQTSFALYLYDTTAGTFRQIGQRSTDDTAVSNGDLAHFPGFTDNSTGGAPSTLVFESRQNLFANGTVTASTTDGLNPTAARPAQFYAFPLVTQTNETPAYKRLTVFPAAFLNISAQPIPSDSVRRMTFQLAFSELGAGNSDLGTEVYYFLLPTVTVSPAAAELSYATGASRQAVSDSPVPTPSPTATPTATPTPTPQTPAAVQGVSPGMLVILNYNTSFNNPIAARTAVGSLNRRFTLPMELSGVTMTIGGVSVGLKAVGQRQITFVVPLGLSSAIAGTSFPVVINNNGVVFKNTITIVPTRPDIFTFSEVPAPNGRARIFDVTNRVFRTEPFNVTVLKYRGGRRVPTVLRLYLTGVNNVTAGTTSAITTTVRIGDTTLSGTQLAANVVLREPGIYTIDFPLPATLVGAGDVPVVVTVTLNGTVFQSRLDDTAPRVRIL